MVQMCRERVEAGTERGAKGKSVLGLHGPFSHAACSAVAPLPPSKNACAIRIQRPSHEREASFVYPQLALINGSHWYEFWTRSSFGRDFSFGSGGTIGRTWHGMTRAAPTPTAPHETTLCMRRHSPRHLSLWGPALVLSTHGGEVAWTRHMRGRAARIDSSGLQAPFPPAVANFPHG